MSGYADLESWRQDRSDGPLVDAAALDLIAAAVVGSPVREVDVLRALCRAALAALPVTQARVHTPAGDVVGPDPDGGGLLHDAATDHRDARVPLLDGKRGWGVLLLRTDETRWETEDLERAGLLVRMATGYLVLLDQRDVARAEAERFVYRASHDDLTGLLRRSAVVELLHHAVASTPRRDTTLAVLYIDLDAFTAVNDAWGHAIGDLVLADVAARLQRTLRVGDTAGRVGGDEFVVVCEELSGSTAEIVVAVLALAMRIQDAFCPAGSTTAAGERADLGVAVRSSIGIAVLDGDTSGPDLLRRADEAMYEAKRAGGQRIRVSDVEVPASGTARGPTPDS